MTKPRMKNIAEGDEQKYYYQFSKINNILEIL